MVARGAVQCGFCTPGMVISAIEAVRLGAAGSEEEIRHSLAGNLCRCTGYGKIVGAVGAYRDGEAAGAAMSAVEVETGTPRGRRPTSPATTRSRRSPGGPSTPPTSRCRGCCTRG